MGNSNTSFEQNLQSKTSNIQTQHSDIDAAILRINTEADRIIALILERGYNDRDQICKRIGYQKIDELSGLFNIQTLDGVRYKLGIVPENTPILEANKTKVCLDIVNFYVKKINLITNIQKELPNCRSMEKEIYDNLTIKLNSKNTSDEEWMQVYKKIEKFNYDIKKRYALIERELERVRKARTMRELDDIAYTTNTILNDTNTICKRHETGLFSYSNKAEQMMSPRQMPAEQIMSPRQMPAEQMMSPRQMPAGLTSQRIPDMRTQIRSPSPVMSRTYMPTEQMMSPRQMPAGLTSQRTYMRSPSPVMSRTEIRSPAPPKKSILKKKTVTFAEPEIHEHIHKVPVTQRSIIQPEVVKHEIMHSQPVLQPVEVKQKKELPVIPVEKFPEAGKQSIRYDKSVKVMGEKISKTSDGTYVKTPKRVETTRTIPKEHMGAFHRNLDPREKILKIEPVYARKMKEKSIPVRAICDYTPQGPGEIGLQEGQATLYLGTNQNGWSRVRHSNQAEGYVPHSYLSK